MADMDLKRLREIHRIFKLRGLTLSAAESCTGGLISHCLTALPGASSFFKAGIVAYSADMKRKVLGVPQKIMDMHGVVSEETAIQMAERMNSLADTDVSVSTTGNLGPDTLEHKPKGLIFIAVSTKKRTTAKKLLLKGTRTQIKEKAAAAVFFLLAEVLKNDF